MSEQLLLRLQSDQNHMTRMAMRLVIGLSLLIHIGLNVYAQMSTDAFLKIEMPILTAVTVVAVFVGNVIFKKH